MSEKLTPERLRDIELSNEYDDGVVWATARDLIAEVKRLRAVNAELLGACNDLVAEFREYVKGDVPADSPIGRVTSIIAKAKE